MAAAARRTNWFAIWISAAAVVAIVAVAGIVIAMNNAAAGPGKTPTSSIINSETGAVVFGSGTNTIDTYVDFLCPYCNQFEQTEGATIKSLVDDGTATLNVHPVTILDTRSNGTKYSSRSASAFYAVAVADPDNAYAFFQALYANQPEEGTDGLTDQQLVDLAKSSGVNVTSDLEDAIMSNRYQQFAQSQSLPDGSTGTPTLIVNGTNVPVTFNPNTDITSHLK